MILVCFLIRTIRSFFVLSDDLKEQNVLKEHCWKLVEVELITMCYDLYFKCFFIIFQVRLIALLYIYRLGYQHQIMKNNEYF